MLFTLMAKGKQTAAPKGQKSIESFFGGGKKEKEPKPEPVEEDEAMQLVEETEDDTACKVEEADVDDDDEEEEEAPAKGEKKSKSTGTSKSTPPDTSSLPPIHEIPAMFADLVGRVPQIKDVAEHIKGRKLRVATMCSGTESPLLALDLICRSIEEQYDVPLQVEHVFSCEIEPFKQAYIERNFHPPLLFRDVCELGETHAYVPHV